MQVKRNPDHGFPCRLSRGRWQTLTQSSLSPHQRKGLRAASGGRAWRREGAGMRRGGGMERGGAWGGSWDWGRGGGVRNQACEAPPRHRRPPGNLQKYDFRYLEPVSSFQKRVGWLGKGLVHTSSPLSPQTATPGLGGIKNRPEPTPRPRAPARRPARPSSLGLAAARPSRRRAFPLLPASLSVRRPAAMSAPRAALCARARASSSRGIPRAPRADASATAVPETPVLSRVSSPGAHRPQRPARSGPSTDSAREWRGSGAR